MRMLVTRAGGSNQQRLLPRSPHGSGEGLTRGDWSRGGLRAWAPPSLLRRRHWHAPRVTEAKHPCPQQCVHGRRGAQVAECLLMTEKQTHRAGPVHTAECLSGSKGRTP